MAERKDRPGVMIYFELREQIDELSVEQKGRLFEAILDYAMDGIKPDFSDDVELRVTWRFVRPAIDRDGNNYNRKVTSNQRNAYVRHWNSYAAKNNLDKDDPILRDKWIESRMREDNEKDLPF